MTADAAFGDWRDSQPSSMWFHDSLSRQAFTAGWDARASIIRPAALVIAAADTLETVANELYGISEGIRGAIRRAHNVDPATTAPAAADQPDENDPAVSDAEGAFDTWISDPGRPPSAATPYEAAHQAFIAAYVAGAIARSAAILQLAEPSAEDIAAAERQRIVRLAVEHHEACLASGSRIGASTMTQFLKLLNAETPETP